MAQKKPLAYSTKTQALSAHLAELARKLGPGAKLPTMQQLSQELGISVMTLNRALSELEAQGIVVRRQGSGTYVGERLGQKTIGLVYDRDVFAPGASPFCGLLLHEIGRQAHEEGERFSFYLTDPSPNGPTVPDDLADALKTRRVSGLLFAGESNPAALKWLLKQKVPLVALSYAPVAPYRVRIHHAQTAYLGAKELARRGCKRIALWIPVGVGIGPEPGQSSFEELDSFRKALKEQGLTYDPKLVWQLNQLSAGVPAAPFETNFEQGSAAAREVFGSGSSAPDGIVILDDMMTRGALTVFVEQDSHPQIASHANRGSHLLLGFDDVIRLEFDPAQISAAMMEMLEILMRGEAPPQDVVSVPPQVVG